MVKAYLRYEHAGAFGVISSAANVLFDGARQLVTGALEAVTVWNIRQGSQVCSLSPDVASSSSSVPKAAAEVTQIALAPGGHQLAAGYSDGSVRLWDMHSRSCLVTLSGHAGAVTALRFSASGALLASGSADTSLIVWDVVGEAGLCRFRGHKDAITDLVLLHQGSKLVSASKDGCVKVWDVALQHCSQTLIGFKGEVWSLDANPGETRLVAGCVDSELRVFAIRSPDDAAAAAAGAGGMVPGAAAPGAAAGSDSEGDEEDALVAAMAAAAARRPGEQQQQQQQQQQQRRQHDLLLPLGSVRRTGQERVALIRYDPAGELLGVMGAGKGLEVFRVRSEEEAARKMKRRRKRRKEKAQAKAAKTGEGATPTGGQQQQQQQQQQQHDEGVDEDGPAVSAPDELGSLLVLTSKHKLKSFAFSPAPPKGCAGQVALGLANNSVEVVDLQPEGAYATASKLELPGHRADVRCLALASDDSQLLSGSNAGAKLWDPLSGACLGSIDAGYALCCCYAPGNRHALIGTKEGTIELVDVGACAVISSTRAHAGPVWSLALLPDKSGFVSGSADKAVKFWTWTVGAAAASGGEHEQQQQQQQQAGTAGGKKAKAKAAAQAAAAAAAAGAQAGGGRQLAFSETRALEMADDVLCVRLSPDGRLLAVSLLDATIKVFYVDTLKFFLSLYGHKLPALTLDISSDSSLLLSGSADKNIKVWGLDFGDCHKSLFAHQDTVTAVSFVRDTHYAFSVGKDRAVKYWDLDRFELLLELPAHHGEVWALAVSAHGDFVLTGSHDRSIRLWERTSEPFFVEEEKERRLESLFESDLEAQQGRAAQQAGGLVLGPEGGAFAGAAPGDEGGAAGPAGRRTLESVSAADSIIDALDMAANEAEKEAEFQAALRAAQAAASVGGKAARAVQQPKRPPANPLMLGLAADAYVLRAVGGVRANELEQALLLLPFNDALRLLTWVSGWLKAGAQVELACRVATLLLRLHHSQLTATPSARAALVELHARLRGAVQGLKDTLGFNIAALRFLQRAAKEGAGVDEADVVLAARQQLLASGDGGGM